MANEGAGIEAIVFGAGAIVLLPLMYGIASFIGGIVTALIYYVAATIVGGLEVSVADSSHSYTTAADSTGESPFIME